MEKRGEGVEQVDVRERDVQYENEYQICSRLYN